MSQIKKDLIVISIEKFFKENDIQFRSKRTFLVNGVKMSKKDIKPILLKFYLKYYNSKWPGLHYDLYEQFKNHLSIYH